MRGSCSVWCDHLWRHSLHSVTLSVRLIQCCQKVVQSLAPQSLDDTFSDHVFSAMKRLWKLQDPGVGSGTLWPVT